MSVSFQLGSELPEPMSVAPTLPSSAPADSSVPQVGPKHCGQCAAVKRLKVKGSGELAGWQARPCVSCTTAQMSASAAAQVSLCMRSALKDDLRPRRLFDAPSEHDPELDYLELTTCLPADDLELDDLPAGLFPGHLGECHEDDELGTNTWAMSFRPASPVPRPTSALDAPLAVLAPPHSPLPTAPPPPVVAGARMMGDRLPVAFCSSSETPLSVLMADRATSFASLTLPPQHTATAPTEPPALLPFGVPSTPAGSSSMATWPAADTGTMSPPPPPMPASSFQAAMAAREHFSSMVQSPALAFAAARMLTRDGGSSCATPSRGTPAAQRPPTPGAPGSNVRRTTSFMDNLEKDGDEDGNEGSVPMSLTDSVLMMELTRSLTTISLGSKRSIEDREAC